MLSILRRQSTVLEKELLEVRQSLEPLKRRVAEHDAIQSKSVKKRNAETGAEISRPKKKQKRRRVPYAENADVDDPNAKSSSADNNEASEVPDATNDSSCWHLAEGQVGSDCQGNEVGLGISDEMMVSFIDADDDEDPDCMDI